MLHSTLTFNQIHPTYDIKKNYVAHVSIVSSRNRQQSPRPLLHTYTPDSKFQGEWGLDPLIKAVSVVVTVATQSP